MDKENTAALEEENLQGEFSASISENEVILELTADLKRLAAEYANYRKRVERDKEIGYQNGASNVLSSLVEILDDLSLAKQHGQYQGGFQQVGDKLTSKLTVIGVKSYGEVDQDFDPTFHDAIAQEFDKEVTSPKISNVLQPGYLFQDKILRPAVVVIKVPEER